MNTFQRNEFQLFQRAGRVFQTSGTREALERLERERSEQMERAQ